MPAFRETTVWAESTAVNHTYLLEGDKMVAYIRQGTTEPFWFSKPIRFSRSGRRFEPAQDSLFESSLRVVQPSRVQQVQGSRGQTYTVNLDDATCSCAGFTFRSTCKHVKQLVDNTRA